MERAQKNDIVSAMIFEKHEASFVLKSFEFAVKEKGLDLEAEGNLPIKAIHAKLKCMYSAADHIAEIRTLECELLGFDKVDLIEGSE